MDRKIKRINQELDNLAELINNAPKIAAKLQKEREEAEAEAEKKERERAAKEAERKARRQLALVHKAEMLAYQASPVDTVRSKVESLLRKLTS